MPDNKEIKWGKSNQTTRKALDLLVRDAVSKGYLTSGFGDYGSSNVHKVVKLDRFCRDKLDATLLIGESTGRINGIRFKNEQDCVMFKLRLE